MAKKRISSVDLNWLIHEQLRGDAGFSDSISLGVVADSKHGWRVVVAARSRPFMTVAGERRLATVQRRLRLEYDLADD